jgi:hypothetical protein
MRLILLDAGPLGLLSNPRESEEAQRCHEWLDAVMWASQVLVPEIDEPSASRAIGRRRALGGYHSLTSGQASTRGTGGTQVAWPC